MQSSRIIGATAAVALTLGSAMVAAPQAQAVTNKDNEVAKFLYADPFGARFMDLDDANHQRWLKLLPLQKKRCSEEGLYWSQMDKHTDLLIENELTIDSDTYFKVTKTKNVKKVKVWSGKKYVTQKNAKKISFKFGYYLDQWPDEVHRDSTTMHVFNHKYWALTKSGMEKCERESL